MRPLFLFSYMTGKWLFDNTFLTLPDRFFVQLRRLYTCSIVYFGTSRHFAQNEMCTLHALPPRAGGGSDLRVNGGRCSTSRLHARFSVLQSRCAGLRRGWPWSECAI